jgi:hypothetical protein
MAKFNFDKAKIRDMVKADELIIDRLIEIIKEKDSNDNSRITQTPSVAFGTEDRPLPRDN